MPPFSRGRRTWPAAVLCSGALVALASGFWVGEGGGSGSSGSSAGAGSWDGSWGGGVVGGGRGFAEALPRRTYDLPWPQCWQSGARTFLPDGCDAAELQKATQSLNQTFEDVELHVSRNAFVVLLGAVLETPHFGRPGPLRLAVLPALPGSLQIALTMLGLGLIDAEQAAASLSDAGGGAARDEDGVLRLPLPGRSLSDFTAPHFVALARGRLGLGRWADLSSVPQRRFEEALLWQSADELRRFAGRAPCAAVAGIGATADVARIRGALVNALHGYATNYYHFVTEQVPVLLAVRRELAWLPKNLVSVLYLGQPWQAEFAKLVGFTDEQLLTYDPCKVYQADLVYTGSVPDAKAAELLLQTRAMVLPSGFGTAAPALPLAAQPSGDAVGQMEPPPCFEGAVGRRPLATVLVLDRRCSLEGPAQGTHCGDRGRNIANFDEVIGVVRATLATADGFAHCTFRAEAHSVQSQAEHFEAADLVIAVVGAGLANMLFMRPGATVVMLHPSSPGTSFSVYSSRCGQSYFWHIAAQLGLEFWALLCPQLSVFGDGNEERVDTVDLEALLQHQVRPKLLDQEASIGDVVTA